MTDSITLDRNFQVDYRFPLESDRLTHITARLFPVVSGSAERSFPQQERGVEGVFPRMSLENLLMKKRTAITRQWFDLVVKTYPSETQQFIKSQRDPFANPVGQTTLKGLQSLFDEILKGIDKESVLPFLDPIIRIRAVQNFSPSMAVAFIPDLKKIVRTLVGDGLLEEQPLADWMTFEHNVDALALIGFDIYAKCRETVYALKADNERTRVLRTFERAGLLVEEPEVEAGPHAS